MRAHEILKEERKNPITVYNNGRGDTMNIEDRGPKYHLMGTDSRYYGWTNRYDMDWDTEDEMMAWLDKNGFRVVGWEGVEEGDVIDTKFTQKLQQKRGMFYNPDLEPPVSRKTGETYIRFETEPMPSGKSAAMIGVLADGTREEIGFTTIKVADALTRAYNAGGYTDLDISRIPLGRSKE